MKRNHRIIASVLTVLMLFTAFGCFAAYAEDMPVEPIIQEPAEEDPDVINAPDMPVDGDNGGDDGGYQPYNPDDLPVETGYYNGDDDSNNGGNSDSGSDYSGYSGNNGSGWVDGDGNVYSSPNEVYVGGGQSYNPPQSTAPSAALYDVKEKKSDEKTLSNNDWNDIASKLRSVSNNPAEDDDGTGDFSFIQQNTAKEDNGHWIIIAGVGCLLLSLTGFIYLIASAVSRRRRMKAVTASGKSGGYYRADDDYDDGYKPAKKEKTPRNGKRYK